MPLSAQTLRNYARVTTPERKKEKEANAALKKQLKAGAEASPNTISSVMLQSCCGYRCNRDSNLAGFTEALNERKDDMTRLQFAIVLLLRCRATAFNDDCGEGYFIGTKSVCKTFFCRAFGFSTKTLERARRILNATAPFVDEESNDQQTGDSAVTRKKKNLSSRPCFKADIATAWIYNYAVIGGDRMPTGEDGELQRIRVPVYDVSQVNGML